MEKHNNIFSIFVDRLLDLPLWVKEILYLELKSDIEKNSLTQDICGNIDKESLYQYYVPTLTYSGKKELSSRSTGPSSTIYKFLEAVSLGLNILEITLSNFWTLEETAMLNIQCVEKEYITAPSSVILKAISLYLAGKIRLGEYFKRLGKINVDQLDTAIRKQKELEAAGQKVGMATVMIRLGYINEEESKMVLLIKDECKKRFILNSDIPGKTSVSGPPQGGASSVSPVGGVSASSEIVLKLTKENTILKNKLQAIGKVLSGD